MLIVPRSNLIPESLVSALADRDASIWLRGTISDESDCAALLEVLRLPWKQVFIENSNPKLVASLDQPDEGALVRRRGYIHVIDSDPSRIELPRRALPVFLLSGRDGDTSSFERQLQRMTILDQLRRSEVRQLVIVGDPDDEVPSGLTDIWRTGFRTRLTLISNHADSSQIIARWIEKNGKGPTASVVSLTSIEFARELSSAFFRAYTDERLAVRQRDGDGEFKVVDLTDIDDPENPVLEYYDLILDRDLTIGSPEELPEDAFNSFFRGEVSDWRPYAAGLPWLRDGNAWTKLQSQLRRLDAAGAAEIRVTYISSESGAGGTTLARQLAFFAAKAGYPTLIAKNIPFTPDQLSITNFITRSKHKREELVNSTPNPIDLDNESRLYETPWLLVFDRVHWEQRDAELRRFRQQLEQSGRPVCILIVKGPQLGTQFLDESRFKQIAVLHHMLDEIDTLDLGRHINKFLRAYGKERPEWQWRSFQEAHSVKHIDGIAAFWITLSFWLQTQYDLSESIQDWVYKSFQEHAVSTEVRKTILQIAAFSSERLPMPESLMEQGASEWPIHLLLDDSKGDLSTLGLLSHSHGGRKYWAIAHDILGKYLLNAIFHDFSARSALGYKDAKDAQHLRFLILQGVSKNPRLGEAEEREYGEEFATTIFKIDPDQGRNSWLHIWRDLLGALDEMPSSLRNGSRVFRHHTAITRRRIAWLDQFAYGVTIEDRESLLRRAIADLIYALRSIDRRPSDESDLYLYNSLANAYFDLAKVRAEQHASSEELAELRGLASEATRLAYEQSPSSPYVIETHVKNLIMSAAESKEKAAEYCTEALEILYSAIGNDHNELRRNSLLTLADRAAKVLMDSQVITNIPTSPKNPAQVLLSAWNTLLLACDGRAPESLETLDPKVLQAVMDVLDSPAGAGNIQVAKLQYQVIVAAAPFDFKKQLEVLEPLAKIDNRLSAQLRLEYALLLFQNMRTQESNSQFKLLRKLWREADSFGQVPPRLRWLLQADGQNRKVVSAMSAYDHGHRAMARVRDFGIIDIPYRAQEFGVQEYRSNQTFAACVSFGHNGPFLRPVNAARY